MKDSPAVVGELVACPFCGKSVATLSNTDELSGRPDVAFMYTVVCDAHRGGCGATVGYEPDQADAIASWNRRATLSALTAEAGKGEVTDAMVEAGCLAVVTVSGFKPENWPHTYPDAGQLRKAVRAALEAALSTATPAGEWREIESAPKDGTAVDVWNGERVPGARWCRPDGGSIDYKDWCVSVPEVDGCSVSWCMENIHPHPTHWHPLPSPPSPGAAK